MQVVERRAPAVAARLRSLADPASYGEACRSVAKAAADFVPRFVREPLHVVRQVLGELDDRRAKPCFRLHAGADESAVDERREFLGRDFFEAHHRAGFVERAPRRQHPLHQARLRSGEHVADVALMLHGRAHGVLDRAAIESGDRLEFIERDDELAAAGLGEASRKGEHVVGETRDVAVGADVRE